MLLGISPQCLYHNIPMTLIEQTAHPRRFLEETYYWFACPVLDCNQRYDMGRGYYTLIDGKPDDTPNKQPCPEWSLRLYIWLSVVRPWQIRCGSARTKIVRLTRGRLDSSCVMSNGTVFPLGSCCFRLDAHSLRILGFRKMNCKNPVLHGCTDR